MFNSINENCPYGLRSAQSNNLQVPHPKSEYFKRTNTTTKNNTEKSIGIYRYYSTRDLGN
jgi:hypothetical protein